MGAKKLDTLFLRCKHRDIFRGRLPLKNGKNYRKYGTIEVSE